MVFDVQAPEITHKSEAGGVKLNLKDEASVCRAFEDIVAAAGAYDPRARISGVSVQPMVDRFEVELILGAKKDQHFGPVILFGMGGIMTEVLKDTALGLPPLNRLLARRLMERTKVFELLKGFRRRPPANLALLEEMLVRLSQLVADRPEVVELDINPLVVCGDEAVALDARARLEPAAVAPPLHLVISPYPNQYETSLITRDALKIRLRPIKPEDAPLLEAFFYSLSPQSVYLRFCRPMKSLSPDMLSRFTQIDYDRQMALVALTENGAGEKIIGVARVINDYGGESAEFAVVVGDEWQGHGIGACLLERSMVIAQERGLKRLWGYILPQNKIMLRLAHNHGWSCSRTAEGYFYSVDLSALSGQGGRTSQAGLLSTEK